MSQDFPQGQADNALEHSLRAELAQGDLIIATARPILRQLLANGDSALFSDEVIARLRGMMAHCARQMLHVLAKEIEPPDCVAFINAHEGSLAGQLLCDNAMLVHAHTLVIEAQLTERLHQRSGIDPVLSPLVQELVASNDATLAGQAMHLLAAQTRFIQQQRRMEWPLTELPGDLFHRAMLVFGAQDFAPAEALAAAQDRLRREHDAGDCRASQIVRLIVSLDRQALRALSLDHAGLAIFVTAVAMASGQERELTVMGLGENQFARLALSLCAAGLAHAEVERQILFLHPDIALPQGFEMFDAARASALLAAGTGTVSN